MARAEQAAQRSERSATSRSCVVPTGPHGQPDCDSVTGFKFKFSSAACHHSARCLPASAQHAMRDETARPARDVADIHRSKHS